MEYNGMSLNVYGISWHIVECLWNIYLDFIEYLVTIYGTPIEYKWNTYRIQWNTNGIPMQYNGTPTECKWNEMEYK